MIDEKRAKELRLYLLHDIEWSENDPYGPGEARHQRDLLAILDEHAALRAELEQKEAHTKTLLQDNAALKEELKKAEAELAAARSGKHE